MLETVISAGRFADARDAWMGWLGIENGVIAARGTGRPPNASVAYDVGGCWVIPGAIDTHVHIGLGLPGTPLTRIADDFETESMGALYGGVTTLISFLPQRHQYEQLLTDAIEMGNGSSFIDFGFHAMLGDAYEWDELPRLIQRGVTSFKFYFNAYRGWEGEQIGVYAVTARTLFEAFQRLDRYGPAVTAIIHAEDQDIIDSLESAIKAEGRDDIGGWSECRPELCCTLASAAAVRMASTSHASCMIAHTSTGAEVELVAKMNVGLGTSVALETCPHYLSLDEGVVRTDLGVLGKVNPTIKRSADSEALWRGIRSGVVTCIGTDHCPYTLAEKVVGADRFDRVWESPPGLANGMEHYVPILWTDGVARNRIDVHQLVDVSSARPARLLGLYPRKGTLQLGTDADLLVVDPERASDVGPGTLHTRAADWSPFWGKTMTATVTHAFVRGRAQLVEGEVDADGKGHGEFLARPL